MLAVRIYVATDIDADHFRSDKAGRDAARSAGRFRGCRCGVRGPGFHFPDERFVYPEERYITVGLLAGRMVIVVWTPTEDGRRVISMRKANAREQARYLDRLA
jgi:Ribonuclease toxin, BrnT, of type II toxin-antitoxin system